ncbi:regulator of G-protein signaling 2-like [Cervus canadensis]|uniref:regulator of G-protein signaling 2-like n=1 Tax=Cervus canadensis TaxID=1574408 RepID=UPI001C9E3E98|nr:regulator of G-protein signaling 2-like [Cervus canadensis]
MQSAMFLAVQHDCGPMDKSAGTWPKNEEKREKMKRTLLKDWKSHLSYFLQNSSSPGKPKTGKKSKQQTFIKPSPEEAQLWSEAFDELLASKYGLAAFRAFLKSEFCEENIEFWLAYEDFKKNKSPQKLSSKAKKIYTDFIEKEAPKEINIDFQTKTLIGGPCHLSLLPGPRGFTPVPDLIMNLVPEPPVYRLTPMAQVPDHLRGPSAEAKFRKARQQPSLMIGWPSETPTPGPPKLFIL